MRQMWRSYCAMTSSLWRWAKLLVLLAALAGEVAMLRVVEGFPAEWVFLVLLIFVHISEDYFAFAGCCSKGSSWSRWMQTSVRGPGMIRGALIWDLVIRAGDYLVMFAAAYFANLLSAGGEAVAGWSEGRLSAVGVTEWILMNSVSVIVLLACFGVELIGTNIARHFFVWQYYMLVVAVIQFAAGLLGQGFLLLNAWLRLDWEIWTATALTASTVLAVGMSVFTVWQGMYYVRKGYRDEE